MSQATGLGQPPATHSHVMAKPVPAPPPVPSGTFSSPPPASRAAARSAPFGSDLGEGVDGSGARTLPQAPAPAGSMIAPKPAPNPAGEPAADPAGEPAAKDAAEPPPLPTADVPPPAAPRPPAPSPLAGPALSFEEDWDEHQETVPYVSLSRPVQKPTQTPAQGFAPVQKPTQTPAQGFAHDWTATPEPSLVYGASGAEVQRTHAPGAPDRHPTLTGYAVPPPPVPPGPVSPASGPVAAGASTGAAMPPAPLPPAPILPEPAPTSRAAGPALAGPPAGHRSVSGRGGRTALLALLLLCGLVAAAVAVLPWPRLYVQVATWMGGGTEAASEGPGASGVAPPATVAGAEVDNPAEPAVLAPVHIEGRGAATDQATRLQDESEVQLAPDTPTAPTAPTAPTVRRARAPRRSTRQVAQQPGEKEPNPVATAETAPSPEARSTRRDTENPVKGDPALAQTLTRNQVATGFNAVRPAVADCAQGGGGVAQVRARIIGSGRVAYSVVEGQYAGSAAGSCIARAVRKARFPRFAGEPIEVEFPFRL